MDQFYLIAVVGSMHHCFKPMHGFYLVMVVGSHASIQKYKKVTMHQQNIYQLGHVSIMHQLTQASILPNNYVGGTHINV